MRLRTRLNLTQLEDRKTPAVLYTVTGTGDDNIRDSVLTLREALLAQRGDVTLSTAELANITYLPALSIDTIGFSPALSGQTITFATSDGSSVNRYGPTGFTISTAVVIDGTGDMVLSGGGAARLFAVTATGDLTLSHLTLKDGLAKGTNGASGGAGLGGAVFVDQGRLTITDSTLIGNNAVGGTGTSRGGQGGGMGSTGTGFGVGGAYPGGTGGFGAGGGTGSSGSGASGGGPGGAGGFGGGGGGGGGVANGGGIATGTPGAGRAGGFGGGAGSNGTSNMYGSGALGGGGAGMGGAVFNNAGTVIVIDSLFALNAAAGGGSGKGYGGAIFSRNGALAVTGSSFLGGSATSGAAAVFVLGDSVFGGAGDVANTGTAAVSLVDSTLDPSATSALVTATNGSGAAVALLPGTGVVTGGITFNSGTTLAFDAAGADPLKVSGTVNLGGATLSVPTTARVPDGPVRVIENDGTDAIVGAFAGIGDPGTVVATSGQAFVVGYASGTGNDVTLTAGAAVVTVAATDASAVERPVNQSPDPGRFTLTRAGDTSAPLTVAYTVSGTAIGGVDYAMLSGHVTFAAGSATAAVDIDAIDNSVIDGTRLVTLTLSARGWYTLAADSTSATASIADDDNAVTVSVTATDPSASERHPSQSANPGRFVLTRTGDTSVPLVVAYTLDGTAVGGTDYQALPTQVTFTPGSATVTIDVYPIYTAGFNNQRTVRLTVTAGGGYTPTSLSSGTVAIDDEVPVAVETLYDFSARERSAGQTVDAAYFRITRGGALADPFTMSYTLSGTAVNGTDYQALPGQVTFGAGSATVTVYVTPIDNAVVDGTRTVTLTPVGVRSSSMLYASGTVFIDDNDAPTPNSVTVAASDATAGERGPGQAADTGRFTLTRTGSTASALTVNYTLSGTAVNGTDYAALPGTVTFAAGSATATVDVRPIDNATVEGARTVVLTLASGGGYRFHVANPPAAPTYTATVTIADNENTVMVAATDRRATESAPGEPAAPARFALVRTGDISMGLTVNYTLSGTAVNGTDYQSLPGRVTFAAGSAVAVVDINPIDNAILDGTRTVTLILVPGNGYASALPAAASATIADNEIVGLAAVTVAATDPSASERAAGETADPGRFTLTRTGDTSAALNVGYVLSGSAANGTDFAVLPGWVTFAAGSATATVDVDPIDNASFDGTRAVVLNLLSGSDYGIASPVSASISLDDNESVVTVAATDASATERATGQTPDPGQFTLTRSGSTAGPLTVSYTLGGTAVRGTDYLSVPTQVTFAAGSATATVSVVPIDNNRLDSNRIVTLTIVSGAGYSVGVSAAAAVTIADNENGVSVVVTDPDASERAAGRAPDPGRFTLTRAGDTSAPLTVNYTLTGAAVNGLDYQLLPTEVTFAAGSATTTVDVSVIDNATSDGARTVVLTLTGGPNYVFDSPATVVVSIADNDAIVTASATDASASERTAMQSPDPGQFTLTRAGDLSAPLTVNYTLGGTAALGRDYPALPGTVNFAAGSATATVDVDVLDNNTLDGARTVVLALTSGSDYTLGASAAATVTIADNENSVSVVATEPSASEGAAGLPAAPGRFTLTRTGDTSVSLTVNYSLGGTAVGGRDYQTLTGAVTFAANSTTATVEVSAIDNGLADGTRTVVLTLAPGSGYVPATSAPAEVTITDADPFVSVAAADASASERGVNQEPDTARFVLTRTGDLSAALAVNYTFGGTGVLGRDFRVVSGAPEVAIFAAGSATAVVDIEPLNNSTLDGTRSVVPTLGPGYGYGFAPGADAAATIADNDAVVRRVATGTAVAGDVRVFDNGSSVPTFALHPYAGYTGGVSVAVGDVNGDGVPDFATGAVNLSSHVKVFDGRSGRELLSFLAFDNFAAGVGVALADLDGDGRAEVIVGALTAAPHVKVFDALTGALRASFLTFTGASFGISVAAGDIDGDGKAEIVVGARGGAAHVKAFDILGREVRSFLAAAPGQAAGATVGVGDLDGDGAAEMLVGTNVSGSYSVSVFDGQTRRRAAVSVAPPGSAAASPFGPQVATGDLDADGDEDLFVAGGPALDMFDGRSLRRLGAFDPYPGYGGAVFLG